ncbi:FAD-dependent oxidoreductase [Mycobacterium sp. NPDC050041]|uniref:FAD-dependent oxidoreductase n=1 Tax=Mycobacterium sp. NPDC050041 TaxID=3364293 RepID=UPI003C2C0F22
MRMTASEMTEPVSSTSVQRCDVCIVGAGVAGLNAAFAASRHLSRGQRIILVDRRGRVGGMWVDTYPYVRLHQPHGMFTAGNVKWTLGRERSYLANKDEVLDHLEHCLDEIRRSVRVDTFFGHDVESVDEHPGRVQVTCRSSTGERLVVEARKVVKAYGFRVTPNDPLPLSSTRARSVSPDTCDVRTGDLAADDAPVWIIGGGKTAMDTAHALITARPGREVNLVAGRGTLFTIRDRAFPDGLRRWYGGTPVSSFAGEACRRFDGTNEDEVWRWQRGMIGTWVTPDAASFLLGVLSEDESRTIRNGLNRVAMDYLVDAVDRDGGVELQFRSGDTTTVPAGSWIVNCTGYVTGSDHPYEPYVSPGGSVVSIQTRSATLHLSTYMGYFMTHLLMLDKFDETPLYEFDFQEMVHRSRTAFPYAVLTVAQYNLGLMYDALPTKVFTDCGLDFDRHYPPHRRLVRMVEFMLTHRREREHQRRTLDTVRERFDIRCGPLRHDQPADADGHAAM